MRHQILNSNSPIYTTKLYLRAQIYEFNQDENEHVICSGQILRITSGRRKCCKTEEAAETQEAQV